MKALVSLLMLAASACTMQAQSYDFLTLKKAGGSETSLGIDHLKITFADGQMIATNGTESFSAPLREMQSMFFAAEATGIAQTTTSATLQVSIVNGTLHASQPAQVYSLDGRLMPTVGLQSGTYLVKIAGKTLKVIAR